VGEWLVHRQPPVSYIGPSEAESKPPEPPTRASFAANPGFAAAMTQNSISDGWSLHPQLTADTTEVGDLPLSRVLLINDANYPWVLLVPRRTGTVEIIDLPERDRAQLMTEI